MDKADVRKFRNFIADLEKPSSSSSASELDEKDVNTERNSEQFVFTNFVKFKDLLILLSWLGNFILFLVCLFFKTKIAFGNHQKTHL